MQGLNSENTSFATHLSSAIICNHLQSFAIICTTHPQNVCELREFSEAGRSELAAFPLCVLAPWRFALNSAVCQEPRRFGI